MSSTPALRPPRHRVSRSAIGYWTLDAAVKGLVLFAVITAIATSAGVPGGVRAIALPLVFAAGVVAVLVVPRWRYAVHRWETTADAVYTQTGWLTQERRIAPITRVQTVDSERGPIEQLFGLATVTVTTASAKGPLRIEALDLATAERLVDELTRVAASSEEDAT